MDLSNINNVNCGRMNKECVECMNVFKTLFAKDVSWVINESAHDVQIVCKEWGTSERKYAKTVKKRLKR